MTRALVIAASLLSFAATPTLAAPCKDARGKFVKCPEAKRKAARCKGGQRQVRRVRVARRETDLGRAPGHRFRRRHRPSLW